MFAPVSPTLDLDARHEHCRYESLDDHAGFTGREVDLLLRCAVSHWPVEGGIAKARYIVDRESGGYCKARNPRSSATGLFQIVAGTWSSWWAAFRPRLRTWNLRDNAALCRANAVIAIIAAHRYGWGAWEVPR